jgi:hypothetical protein
MSVHCLHVHALNQSDKTGRDTKDIVGEIMSSFEPLGMLTVMSVQFGIYVTSDTSRLKRYSAAV